MEQRAYFFYADWCKPCQQTKPIWNKISNIYTMNGIKIKEYDYDISETKELMSLMEIKTIPTLVVYDVPFRNDYEDIKDGKKIYQGDSKEIPKTATNIVTTFSIDEDF